MPIQISTPFSQQERYLPGGVGSQGPQGYQGFQGFQGPPGKDATGLPPPADGSVAAGMTNVDVTGHIEQFSPVTAFGEQADSTNPAHMGLVVGIALDEAWPGDNLVVQYYGILDNPAWQWSAGHKLWVNGTGLNYQPPITGWNQLIAACVSETQIFIRLHEPILL